MFQRYTEKVRRALFFSRHEAQASGSKSIESEHLLLGVTREDPNLIPSLVNTDLSQDALRSEIQTQSGPAKDLAQAAVDLPFSNESKRILAYSAEESKRVGDGHIGTEHLLLALIREESCRAAKILRGHGADLKTLRQTLATKPSA